MRVVVRVGGSVVASPLNAPLIGKYVDLLKGLKLQGHEVVAVIGGGSLAREFIRVAAELGLEEARRIRPTDMSVTKRPSRGATSRSSLKTWPKRPISKAIPMSGSMA